MPVYRKGITMGRIEEYLERAKDLAEEAGDAAKNLAGEAFGKAKELTEEGGKVRELAKTAKDQTAAVTLGAREKVGGIIQDAKAVKEVKLALAELEALPEDGSILYKMDLEAIINDMNKLALYITDNRLDDASVAEEIRKVMAKVKPDDLTEALQGENAEEQLSDENLIIQKAKTTAYGACVKALEAIGASAE